MAKRATINDVAKEARVSVATVDRVLNGYVVDFIFMRLGPWQTNVFNVADMCIVAAFALFFWAAIQQSKAEGHRGHEEDEHDPELTTG